MSIGIWLLMASALLSKTALPTWRYNQGWGVRPRFSFVSFA
ncbi:DUF3309 family protein [Microvirga zambiensis]|nr:hypothetical protein [Microvirga zambiensis]